MLSCVWAAKRVKLCPFLPVHAICIRLFMPKPFVVCAEVSVARSSCNKSSLDLSFQSRDFAREVGFRFQAQLVHVEQLICIIEIAASHVLVWVYG